VVVVTELEPISSVVVDVEIEVKLGHGHEDGHERARIPVNSEKSQTMAMISVLMHQIVQQQKVKPKISCPKIEI